MSDRRRALRVLHLASFTGNIGDNANHFGARAQFDANLPFLFDYTPLEMREFFWGERHFDDSFVDLANRFDLLLIGGGNYFELWVEKSRSGCSIDLSLEQLQAIRVPILFYGLGIDSGQGVPDECRERFQCFLDAILAAPNRLVAVRNDGAMTTLGRYFAGSALEKVLQVPDGGFFYSPPRQEHVELSDGARHIAINLAGDMLETRFSGKPGTLTCDEFLRQFARALVQILEREADTRLVFISHIFRDLDVIHRALDALPDSLRRQRIAVAPQINGAAACHKLFDLYRQCDATLAMRFHANVCPLNMARPTLGLNCYPQIEQLYRELGRPDDVVAVNRPDFSDTLSNKVSQLLAGDYQPIDMGALHQGIQASHQRIAAWLEGMF